VLSVAGGVVARIKDGIPDNTPVGSIPPDLTTETVGGNSVWVDIGGGRFAYYGHLQPGSLTVDVGDHVRRGQVLGLLGHSGNSSAPHLHFHVTDAPLLADSNGLPFMFRFFESEGTVANPEEVLGGGVATVDPTLSGPHSRQLPLNLQIISF
jgi:murein DD-endopeptidase MepM/ murein hydrolase activator NlpD